MKKIFLILLLATNCYAEPFRYDKPTICDDVKEVLKLIEEYKEKIIFNSISLQSKMSCTFTTCAVKFSAKRENEEKRLRRVSCGELRKVNLV